MRVVLIAKELLGFLKSYAAISCRYIRDTYRLCRELIINSGMILGIKSSKDFVKKFILLDLCTAGACSIMIYSLCFFCIKNNISFPVDSAGRGLYVFARYSINDEQREARITITDETLYDIYYRNTYNVCLTYDEYYYLLSEANDWTDEVFHEIQAGDTIIVLYWVSPRN